MATSRLLVGPAGMDLGIAEILRTAIGKAEADAEFVAAMKKGEFEIATAKPEELKADIQAAVAEFTTVRDLVKSYVK